MGLCVSVSSRLGAVYSHPRGAMLPVLWFFFFCVCAHVYVVVCGMNSKESLRNGSIPLV